MIPVSLILVELIRLMSEYLLRLCYVLSALVLCFVFCVYDLCSYIYTGYFLLKSIQYKDLNNYDCINPLIGVETMITARKHK